MEDKLLDKAYAKLTEWGPNLRLPIEERVEKHFPKTSEEERKEILKQVDLVDKTVWSLAERGGEAKMKKEEVVSELQSSHPFLKKKGLSQALFLVNYYAFHEGYDK